MYKHFARQDGQDGKNQKENHTTKAIKIPKIKRQKYGMNKTDGFQKICIPVVIRDDAFSKVKSISVTPYKLS